MAKQAKKVSESSIVEPSIVIDGHTNPFIPFFDKEPELTAVGYVKIPNSNTYASYTITIKGEKVTKIVCDEPNLKAIAEESAKISFINNFVDKDEE